MSGPFLDHRSFQCLSRFVRGRSVLLIALRLEQGSGFAVSEIDPIGQGPNDPPAIGTGLSAGSDFELLDRTLAREWRLEGIPSRRRARRARDRPRHESASMGL